MTALRNENIEAILVGAMERLKRGWCQYSPAMTKRGTTTWPSSDAAAQWCLSGACHAASFELIPDVARMDHIRSMTVSDVLERLQEEINRNSTVDPDGFKWSGYGSIVNWNDAPSRTKEEVVSLIERTIAKLKEEE